MSGTVRVRILVAVDARGRWNSAGWIGADEDDMRENISVGVDMAPGEVYHWIEAYVPIPVPVVSVVQGTVRRAVE